MMVMDAYARCLACPRCRPTGAAFNAYQKHLAIWRRFDRRALGCGRSVELHTISRTARASMPHGSCRRRGFDKLPRAEVLMLVRGGKTM